MRITTFAKEEDIRTLRYVVIKFDEEQEAARWKKILLFKAKAGS